MQEYKKLRSDRMYSITLSTHPFVPNKVFSKYRDGQLFKESNGVWKAIFWQLRKPNMAEIQADSSIELQEKIKEKSIEEDFFYKIKLGK